MGLHALACSLFLLPETGNVMVAINNDEWVIFNINNEYTLHREKRLKIHNSHV